MQDISRKLIKATTQPTMKRIKNGQKNCFVVLEKTALNDTTLSWQAKGLHSYLMGLPIEWRVNIEDIANRSTNGKDSVKAAMDELIKAGYISRKKITVKGKFAGYDYTLYEKPSTEKPSTEKPSTEKPSTEKPSTEKPSTEKPSTEKPSTEKPSLISIEEVSIEEVSIEEVSIDNISSSSSSEINFENFEEEKAETQQAKADETNKGFVAVALEYANMSDFVLFAKQRHPELEGIDVDYQYYFDGAKRKSTAKTAEKLYSSGLGFIKADAAKNNVKLNQTISNNKKQPNEKSNYPRPATTRVAPKVNHETRTKSAKQIQQEAAYYAKKQRDADIAEARQQASSEQP